MSLQFHAIWSDLTDQPFNLEFAVTMRCNSKCNQCSVWRYRTDKKEMSTEEIRRIFESYRGFKLVGITGGEAYMRPDLREIVRIIVTTQRQLKWISCTSNGLIPTIPERLKEILSDHPQVPYTQFISVDGPKEIHDKARGVDGSWEMATNILGKITDFQDDFPHFRAGFVTLCSPWNIDRFDEVLDEAERLRDTYGLEPSFCIWFIGQLYKNTTAEGQSTPDANGFRTKMLPYIPRMKEIVSTSSYYSIGRRVFYDLLEGWIKNPSQTIVPCGAAKTRYFLDPYGTVLPCTIWDNPIINLRDVDFNWSTMLSSPERALVRKAVQCQECPICANTCETIPAMNTQPNRVFLKWIQTKVSDKH